MQENKRFAGHFSAVFTIIIWGTTFISTKILLNNYRPIEILFFRFMIGLFILTIVYPHRLKSAEKKQEIMFALAGLCGITLYYLLENIALTYTMASNVGIIISVAPFFTAIFAHYCLKGERLKMNFFIGFIAAITGICLISVNTSTVFKLNPLGDFLALLASAVWAIYSILTRKISSFGYNTIQTTRRIFFYGILFMIPTFPFFDFHPDIKYLADPIVLFNILFLGLGASALCFVTWNYAVKILGAVKTSIYIYIVPVITVVTSVIILHEKITWLSVAGMILALSGLFISEKLPSKKTDTIVSV